MSAQVQIQANDDIQRGLAGVYFDKTSITEIRGRHGELRYRGYSIEDLIVNPCYENVVYLLIHGQWPSAEQSKLFFTDLAARRTLSENTIELLRMFKQASPEVALRTAVSSLGAYRSRDASPLDEALDLIAKIPSIIVVHHALRKGRVPLEPGTDLDLASDFLRRLLGRLPMTLECHFINQDFVLHADHGANASTFAARVVASTEADVYGAFSAAVAALSGPLHGGAVTAAAAMLDHIASPDEVPAFVANRRAKGLPIYGFGHRVYRSQDPRSAPYRAAARKFASINDQTTLAVLDALVNEMAPLQRFGIAPNVDLYTASVYRMLEISDDLANSLFVAGRCAGWAAQVLEQQSNNVLIRPRLKYVGASPRDLANDGES